MPFRPMEHSIVTHTPIHRVLFTLTLAFILSACGPIPVKQFSQSMYAGSELRTLHYYGYSSDCATRRPNLRIKKRPENGTLSIRDEKMKISGKPANIGKKRGLCVGDTVIGRVVYYLPNDGFKGKDEFLIENSFPGSTGITRKNVVVTVR